jgi:hypothetical protein
MKFFILLFSLFLVSAQSTAAERTTAFNTYNEAYDMVEGFMDFEGGKRNDDTFARRIHLMGYVTGVVDHIRKDSVQGHCNVPSYNMELVLGFARYFMRNKYMIKSKNRPTAVWVEKFMDEKYSCIR